MKDPTQVLFGALRAYIPRDYSTEYLSWIPIFLLALALYIRVAEARIRLRMLTPTWPVLLPLVFAGPAGILLLSFLTVAAAFSPLRGQGLLSAFFSLAAEEHSEAHWILARIVRAWHWASSYLTRFGTTGTLTVIPWNREAAIIRQMDGFSQAEVEGFSKARELIGYRSLFVLGILLFVLTTVLTNPVVAISITSIVLTCATAADSVDYAEFEELVVKPEPGPIREGIVRISMNGLFWHASGIGYVHEGTLHTRYHVTLGQPIEVDGRLYKPTMVSKVRDMVTYFGPSKMRAMRQDDTLVAAVVDEFGGVNAVMTKPSVSPDGTVTFVNLPTSVPGTSGSPIFRLIRKTTDYSSIEDEDDREDARMLDEIRMDSSRFCYDLVGVTGYFLSYRDQQAALAAGTSQAEMIFTEPDRAFKHEFDPYAYGHQQIFMHPGAGKTRRVALEIAKACRGTKRLVIVTAPTRAIVKDMTRIFKDFRVSDYSMGGARSGSPQVIVAPHDVVFSWLLSRHFLFQKDTVLVIDEAHTHSTKTMALVKWARHRSSNRDNKFSCIEMTATGHDVRRDADVVMDGSNFTIDQRFYNAKDFVPTILEAVTLAPNAKVIAFCPSVDKGVRSIERVAKEIARADPSIRVIKFARKWFSENYASVCARAEVPTVVLSTSVSEVGVNVSADVCVDCGEQLVFERDRISGHVVRSMRTTTEAQRVQRRGRVGRDRPGVYYEPRSLGSRDSVYHAGAIEEEESDAIAHLLDVPGCKPTLLTLQQLLAWARHEVDGSYQDVKGLGTVRRIYDHTGRRLGLGTIQGRFREELKRTLSDKAVVLCDTSVCLDEYDERDDKMYVSWVAPLLKFPVSRQPTDAGDVQLHPHDERSYEAVHQATPARAETEECLREARVAGFDLALDHLELSRRGGKPVEHHHVCSCGHLWKHVHSYDDKISAHPQGTLCPCCRRGTGARALTAIAGLVRAGIG